MSNWNRILPAVALACALLAPGCVNTSGPEASARIPERGDVLTAHLGSDRVQVMGYESSWHPESTRLLCRYQEEDFQAQCHRGRGCVEVRPIEFGRLQSRSVCYGIDWIRERFAWEE